MRPRVTPPKDERGSGHSAEPWVSVDEVAAHLGVRKDSVYRWIEKRGLPAKKIGKLWKLKLSEVDAWVRQSGEEPGSEESSVVTLRDKADGHPVAVAAAAPQAPVPKPAAPTRVLVIDDDPLVRETLGEYLTERGYTTMLAGDGAQALAKLTAPQGASEATPGRPSLIILDLGMPNLDGWKFREQQLSHPNLATIPVIVVTATANPNIDAAAILRKPLRLPLLAKAMETVLARAQAEASRTSDGEAVSEGKSKA